MLVLRYFVYSHLAESINPLGTDHPDILFVNISESESEMSLGFKSLGTFFPLTQRSSASRCSNLDKGMCSAVCIGMKAIYILKIL
jgi:hypothetical protein